ncbi:MAG: trans-aconitate 2-methyltransferase [Mycobacteriales bacterium]
MTGPITEPVAVPPTGPPTGPVAVPPARWDASLYAANTAHHRRYDRDVLRGVRLRRGDWALDLGCGVGDFTARLAGLVPAGQVLGVDADQDMVATARQRNAAGHVRFEVCRAQELDAVAPAGRYDAVISVAVLHWIPATDHPRVLGQVRRVLRRGGAFRAEFGGHGQIAAVRQVLDEEARRAGGRPSGWYFPTPDEYAPMLAQAGLLTGTDGWLRLVRQRRELPDDTAFLGWLRSQVLVAYDALVPADRLRAFRQAAEERAIAESRGPDGRFDQEYIRLDLLAHAD